MTDGEILETAREVGWNTEHKASNDYLVRFARALMDKRWVSLTDQEMYDLFFNDQYGPHLPEYLVNTIKCIEAALKEKNNG